MSWQTYGRGGVLGAVDLFDQLSPLSGGKYEVDAVTHCLPAPMVFNTFKCNSLSVCEGNFDRAYAVLYHYFQFYH